MQDTIVAIRKGGDKLVVGNLESDKYPSIEFGTDPHQVRNTPKFGAPMVILDVNNIHLGPEGPPTCM